jgi:hypothetical protein
MENEAATIADQVTEPETEEPAADQDTVVDGQNVSLELRLVVQDEDSYSDRFLERLCLPFPFTDNFVGVFLELLGGKRFKNRSSNIAKIKEWIKCTPIEKRAFLFMKKDSLVQVCLAQLRGSKTSYMCKDRDALIDLLVQHQQNPQIPLLQQEEVALHHPPSPVLSEFLMKEVISGAFLRPMKGSSRLNLRIGLDNEEPLLLHLLSKSKESNVIIPDENNKVICIQVNEIYRPGMVRKTGGKEYIKTSIDALGVAEVDGSIPRLVGIEVKTRTEETTRQPEINIRCNLHQNQTFALLKWKE